MRRTAISLAMCLGLLALATPAQAAPGDLDTTFNPTGPMPGTVRTDFTSKSDSAVGVAIQSNGDIVAVGTAGSPDSAFAVARYLPGGTLDAGFGSGGEVTTNIGAFRDAAIGVAIQGDGKIVVAGAVGIDSPDPKWGLVRYLTDGTPDPAFGVSGIVLTNIVKRRADEAVGVALQSDGNIVVSGLAGGGGNPDFAVARYLKTNGALDLTFGPLHTGIVRTDFGTGSADAGFGGIVIQPDHRIVVGGYSFPAGSGDASMALARYDADGNLDTTFSGDGKFTINFSTNFDFLAGIALDGTKIVGAGESNTFGPDPRAALIRVTGAGVADTTFNLDGKETFNPSRQEDFASAVAIDHDGNIVTAGGSGFGPGLNSRFFVVRLDDSDGKPDDTFGAGHTGEVFTDIGPRFDYANALAIDGTGSIVAAGESGGFGGNNKFALARYLST